MSFLFKAKIPCEDFKLEAQKYKIPLKFFTVALDLVTMYMLIPVGSSGLMYMYFCEEYCDKEKLVDLVNELERLGFKQAESFELPLP